MDLAETSFFPDGVFGTKSSLDGDLGNKMNSGEGGGCQNRT